MPAGLNFSLERKNTGSRSGQTWAVAVGLFDAAGAEIGRGLDRDLGGKGVDGPVRLARGGGFGSGHRVGNDDEGGRYICRRAKKSGAFFCAFGTRCFLF